MAELISIIGLGRTGMPAAKAYLAAGFKVFGHDVRKEVTDEFVKAGGTIQSSPAACARQGGFILIFVLDDRQLLQVIEGDQGILASIARGTTIICMSTVSRPLIETVSAKCKSAGAAFVDCPFTGGPARIASRSLTLIAAAPDDLLQKVKPVLEVVGKIVHAGSAPGMGQAIKHCNQLFVGATHGAVMEVITLARKLSLDPALVCSVVASGIAGSDYFRMLSESVLHKKPSPGSLGQMAKDMAIVRSTLEDAHVNAIVASAAADYFSESMRQGMQGREGADLIEIVEQWPAKKVADQ